jgi:hypothetical protein
MDKSGGNEKQHSSDEEGSDHEQSTQGSAPLRGSKLETEEKKLTASGRRKVNIEFIENKSRRHVTFSKRKAGLIKKAYELSTLTGTQILLLIASETGNVYTFATPKLQPLITKPEGKALIQSCLHPTTDTSSNPNPSSPPSISETPGSPHENKSSTSTNPSSPPSANPPSKQAEVVTFHNESANFPQPPTTSSHPPNSYYSAQPNFTSFTPANY